LHHLKINLWCLFEEGNRQEARGKRNLRYYIRLKEEVKMAEINDFKDLLIWQKGMDISEKCYFLTKNFPKEEIYGMVQQIRRSSVSIPANIAEGYGRRSSRDYARFLNIIQGSINELETHLILSERIRLCTLDEIDLIIKLLHEETRMIIALIKKLEL
jgi:four helix bundle protein